MTQREKQVVESVEFAAFITRENEYRKVVGQPPMRPQEREYWMRNHPYARKLSSDNPIAAS